MQFELKAFDEDLVVVGPGMTAARHQEIKAGLPADISERVIGWRRTGR